jgi:UDPglucose 6-dehydrogenase
MANIAVLGAGYVGLTTAACFAKLGNSVIVSDVDPK